MPELEGTLDELYAADLEQFVETRKRLAKELKDGGDADGATTVTAARKPTVAAWALNQLARTRRKDVDLLLDAGHRMRQAQAGLLQGEGQAAFASARSAEQTAVANLVRQARALLEERAPASPSTLDQVNESLRAAAVSDEGRELLATGRFERAFTGDGGFEALAALAPATSPTRARTKNNDKQAALRHAKAKLREAETQLQDAERAAATAENAVSDLERELQVARKQRDEARPVLHEAAKARAAAERDVAKHTRRKTS